MKRGAWVAAVIVAAILTGCGGSKDRSDERSASTTEPYAGAVCDLIVVPLEWMQKDGSTFTDVVEDRDDDGDGIGVSAAVAFAVSARGLDRAGRFRPVIDYMTERATAAASERGGEPPDLTGTVRANARELDAFVADGGCG